MLEEKADTYEALGERELARLFGQADEGAVRLLTAKNNQRLFRVAWSILKSRGDAEDVVQETYLQAFTAIASFEGRSSLSTWLTRIAVNLSLERQRKNARKLEKLDTSSVTVLDEYREKLMSGSSNIEPDREALRAQLRRTLEEAVSRLPEGFRLVFVLREIEQLTLREVAEALDLPAATVKTRCLRARRRLQKELAPELEDLLAGSIHFAGVDCERVTRRVLDILAVQTP